ncbi:DUF6584 family protein [Klenkia taihuensis]|uniref:Tetratricopeptide repeat-containing protein n=1 Tax=Klenkia taihuensis TaxID=1225127 RepID=A0A1I1SUE4_9ACTN|nr:DUF6584 family protein [Klenkia taihuensis]GHE13197.1 hypothetical protein GCM10011381_34290 [Klenkia taihuensis]SFD50077.1 hypothetical protein SAMN05661030_3542 [Klenkia taihuensis]
MPADQTLARARAELAAGDVATARQRLRSLVGTYPARLDVRSALALAYRTAGDLAQAGRWSYLDAEPDPVERAAFHEAWPTAGERVRALRWSGPEDAAGPSAAERLRALRTEAEEEAGGPVDWATGRRREEPWEPTAGDRVLDWAIGGVVVLVLGCTVVGTVTVVRWLVDLVS